MKGRGKAHAYFSTHLIASLIHLELLSSWWLLSWLQNVGPVSKAVLYKGIYIPVKVVSLKISPTYILQFRKLTKSIINTSVQGASADKPHLAFGKSNFEIKPFLRHWKKKKLYKQTLSSESFIQKHLQCYLWTLEHQDDHLYLLRVMLMKTFAF